MMTVFVAGASGVVGRALIPILAGKGWRVVGLTRDAQKQSLISELGAEPVIADVFDKVALSRLVEAAKPQVVIHQLTDLPPGLDPTRMEEATKRNARIRGEGTRNLVEAAIRYGVERFIAQSVAFAYADGPLPHVESDPLAIHAEGRAGVSARGVASLERQVLDAPLVGIILRYGKLYGPGTGFDQPAPAGPVSVEAAAIAATLAVTRGDTGIYNIAEADGVIDSEKARRALGWEHDMRV